MTDMPPVLRGNNVVRNGSFLSLLLKNLYSQHQSDQPLSSCPAVKRFQMIEKVTIPCFLAPHADMWTFLRTMTDSKTTPLRMKKEMMMTGHLGHFRRGLP
jgi:hypothetical protein